MAFLIEGGFLRKKNLVAGMHIEFSGAVTVTGAPNVNSDWLRVVETHVDRGTL